MATLICLVSIRTDTGGIIKTKPLLGNTNLHLEIKSHASKSQRDRLVRRLGGRIASSCHATSLDLAQLGNGVERELGTLDNARKRNAFMFGQEL
jgi:hypothetical protein